MPTWEFTAGDTSGGGSYGSNLTRFSGMAGRLGNQSGGETALQAKVFSTYTWANLYVRVKTKTFVGSPTVRSRVGAVNGNLLTTITGTGVFEDTVNTDALVSGNLINLVVVTPNEVGESMILNLVGTTLQDTGTNATLAIASGTTPSVASALTRFAPIGGALGLSSVLGSIEEDLQYTIRRATTYSNLRATVLTNSLDAGNTAWTFRIDGGQGPANGNQALSIAFGATGAFEDTTNSDAMEAGAVVRTQVVTSGTAGSFNPRLVQMAFTATGREVMSASNAPVSGSADRYYGAEGDALSTITEAESQIAARAAFTASSLLINVTAHAAPGAVDVFLRQNGANSALTVNIAASATGVFEDTTNSVSIAVTNTYNFFADVAVGGGVITIAIIGFALGPTDAISGGGRGYPGQMHNRRHQARGRGLRVP